MTHRLYAVDRQRMHNIMRLECNNASDRKCMSLMYIAPLPMSIGDSQDNAHRKKARNEYIKKKSFIYD